MTVIARHSGDFGLPSGIGTAVEDLERGFMSAVAGLTAHSGGGQGSALPLTAAVNRVLTVAAAGDSVLLPKATVGASIVVMNKAATNSMNVFPSTGDQVNALGANAAYALAATKVVRFYCAVAGTWDSLLSA
jgi:hypothetical protein